MDSFKFYIELFSLDINDSFIGLNIEAYSPLYSECLGIGVESLL